MGFQEIILLIIFMLAGAGLSILDAHWELHTALLEAVHAAVLSLLLLGGMVAHVRYPKIRQFGWTQILLGIGLLTLGAWVDILDQYDVVILGIPFGHTWQQAFIEKILGYSAGIGMIGVGFFQWLPWMIQTRDEEERLNEKLTHTLTSVEDRVESERIHISRELHDDVAQRLTALGFQVQLIEPSVPDTARESLQGIRQDLSDCLKSIRTISRNLRPDTLEVLGVIAALESYLEKNRQQSPNIHFQCQVHQRPALTEALQKGLDKTAQLHVYRLIQESIRNAVKHAHATHITVSLALSSSPEQLVATITDNGKGLPWQASAEPTSAELLQAGHLGIAGLRERASEVNGTYTLSNATEGSGTHITITVPLLGLAVPAP